MRFQRQDLLIAIVVVAITGDAVSVLLPQIDLPLINSPASDWIAQIAVGVACYLVVSSVIYRYFHRFPMLLPKCPHCRNANRHYFSLNQRWPIEMIECATCRSTIELSMTPTAKESGTPGCLRFQLLWPYSIGGRWRRV